MMLRFPRVRLARKSRDSSIQRRRTLVSNLDDTVIVPELTYTTLDVVVLTAMGEQAAIEAKEAPKTG
jgi:hypothetical protein